MPGSIIQNVKKRKVDCEYIQRETNKSKRSRNDNQSEEKSWDGVNSSTSTNFNEVKDNKHKDRYVKVLRKIQELERELFDYDDDESNDSASDLDTLEDEMYKIDGQRAESIGYAMCANETLKFLHDQGCKSDNPLVINLRKLLIANAEELN